MLFWSIPSFSQLISSKLIFLYPKPGEMRAGGGWELFLCLPVWFPNIISISQRLRCTWSCPLLGMGELEVITGCLGKDGTEKGSTHQGSGRKFSWLLLKEHTVAWQQNLFIQPLQFCTCFLQPPPLISNLEGCQPLNSGDSSQSGAESWLVLRTNQEQWHLNDYLFKVKLHDDHLDAAILDLCCPTETRCYGKYKNLYLAGWEDRFGFLGYCPVCRIPVLLKGWGLGF